MLTSRDGRSRLAAAGLLDAAGGRDGETSMPEQYAEVTSGAECCDKMMNVSMPTHSVDSSVEQTCEGKAGDEVVAVEALSVELVGSGGRADEIVGDEVAAGG